MPLARRSLSTNVQLADASADDTAASMNALNTATYGRIRSGRKVLEESARSRPLRDASAAPSSPTHNVSC